MKPLVQEQCFNLWLYRVLLWHLIYGSWIKILKMHHQTSVKNYGKQYTRNDHLHLPFLLLALVPTMDHSTPIFFAGS